MSYCNHPNMRSTARVDYCPDCGYEYYYGDAHATGEACISKEINPGRSRRADEEEYMTSGMHFPSMQDPDLYASNNDPNYGADDYGIVDDEY